MVATLIVSGVSFLLFVFFQAQGIYTGDSGDLVTAAAVAGVPHPPGYPLYTLLGWLFSALPVLTASWRITLLSSLPHAFTVGLVYFLIYRLTKQNVLAGVLGAFTLSANYLFFLYGVTPEVFALFDLFVVVLATLLLVWSARGDYRYLRVISFVFGLSLSHHHVVLFFVPAIMVLLWDNRKRLLATRSPLRELMYCLSLFGAGLIPYLYVPYAARFDPIINWDRAVTWEGFFRLITRMDYGTFVSGGSFGQTIGERLLSIVAYGNFLLTDWTWVGVGLGALGLYALFMRARYVFRFIVFGIVFLGPLFFFYASFPLVSRFTLGTYERFLLPSYVLVAVLIGVGFDYLTRQTTAVLLPTFASGKRRVVVLLLFVTFLIYPLSHLGMTVYRFWGLPQDRTAENLGRDLLDAAPYGAVILMSQDTALFTSQYVRYVLNVRPDTALIHAARLPSPDYQIVVKKHFARLIFPDAPPGTFISEFVKANTAAGIPVMSNTILPVGEGWYWVSRGLLYEAVPVGELPSADAMYAHAKSQFARLHDPKQGLLSRFPHLMLSDVLDVYANGYIALGKTLVRAGLWEEARGVFTTAVGFAGDTSMVEGLELLGLTQLYFKECPQALESFQEASSRSLVASSVHRRLEAITYAECLNDASRAAELFSELENMERVSDVPLEAL